MGCFFARRVPMFPVVTPSEYLDAVERALDLPSRKRGAAYKNGLEHLVGGRPVRAARIFSSLLERRPADPTLHHALGLSYLRSGNARLAARHLELALVLLGRITTPSPSLLHSLRIEIEASVARFALTATYKRLGHRAGVIYCLLAQNQPLSWDIQYRPPS